MDYLKKQLTDDKIKFNETKRDSIYLEKLDYKKAVSIHGAEFFRYNYYVQEHGLVFEIMKNKPKSAILPDFKTA